MTNIKILGSESEPGKNRNHQTKQKSAANNRHF